MRYRPPLPFAVWAQSDYKHERLTELIALLGTPFLQELITEVRACACTIRSPCNAGDVTACMIASVQVAVSFITNHKEHNWDFKLHYETKRDHTLTVRIPGELWKKGASCPLFDPYNWMPTRGKRSNRARKERHDDASVGGAVPISFSTATFTRRVGQMHFSLAVAVQKKVRVLVVATSVSLSCHISACEGLSSLLCCVQVAPCSGGVEPVADVITKTFGHAVRDVSGIVVMMIMVVLTALARCASQTVDKSQHRGQVRQPCWWSPT